MIRGTTPTHIFELPIEASLIKDLRLSYAQDEVVTDENGNTTLVTKELITKKKADVNLEGKTIKVVLTQKETLLFNHSMNVARIQLRIKTTDGAVLSSGIMNINVWETLNEDELV